MLRNARQWTPYDRARRATPPLAKSSDKKRSHVKHVILSLYLESAEAHERKVEDSTETKEIRDFVEMTNKCMEWKKFFGAREGSIIRCPFSSRKPTKGLPCLRVKQDEQRVIAVTAEDNRRILNQLSHLEYLMKRTLLLRLVRMWFEQFYSGVITIAFVAGAVYMSYPFNIWDVGRPYRRDYCTPASGNKVCYELDRLNAFQDIV
uniref:Complex I-B15 n=1 Tax=Angiostrongylus cantonensis TaxID=6313 RepID=A0A158P5R4_ANGCA